MIRWPEDMEDHTWQVKIENFPQKPSWLCYVKKEIGFSRPKQFQIHHLRRIVKGNSQKIMEHDGTCRYVP
jgi:hypothetical protein